MKHEIKVTILLLLMFITTQLIGLVVIDAYAPKTAEIAVNGTVTNITVANEIPYGMQPPEMKKAEISLANIAVSLIIAVLIFILLMKLKARSLIKIWFVMVIFLTISIALTALLMKLFPESNLRFDTLAVLISIPLTFYKIFKRNFIAHNFTELLIYPGMAAVFVPILSVWTTIVLLLIISVYDMWAVWKSKLMINMAKFQIQKLKVFTGFLVPYMQKKDAARLRNAQKIKTVKARTAKLKKMKIKISLALLGGGDVAFPLIFAGVVYRSVGLVPALIIIAGSTISLLLLFMFSRKGKFYPAMPFITAGCLLGWLVTLLL
jgi:presenilin-like A22 family membrane protease